VRELSSGIAPNSFCHSQVPGIFWKKRCLLCPSRSATTSHLFHLPQHFQLLCPSFSLEPLRCVCVVVLILRPERVVQMTELQLQRLQLPRCR
jgi:hypothetical protein